MRLSHKKAAVRNSYRSFFVTAVEWKINAQYYRFAVRPASSKAAMISVSFVFDGA